MILSEKIVNTNEYAGCVDLITGINDFDSQVEFDESTHTYTLDGKIIPSVTQLLDDGTYLNVDEEILKYAQNKGSIVHKEIEEYLKHDLKGFTSEFYEFLNIYTTEHEKFLKKAIFDFKTYSVASPKNREKCYKQIKLYAEAIKYLIGEEIEEYYLVHLPHDKKARVYDLKEEFENGN